MMNEVPCAKKKLIALKFSALLVPLHTHTTATKKYRPVFMYSCHRRLFRENTDCKKKQFFIYLSVDFNLQKCIYWDFILLSPPQLIETSRKCAFFTFFNFLLRLLFAMFFLFLLFFHPSSSSSPTVRKESIVIISAE